MAHKHLHNVDLLTRLNHEEERAEGYLKQFHRYLGIEPKPDSEEEDKEFKPLKGYESPGAKGRRLQAESLKKAQEVLKKVDELEKDATRPH